jgi:hypothetical protein
MPPSFVSACGLVEEMHSCIMSMAFWWDTCACIVCFVCRTHSLSRCCLYQATRDVDVAVKAPAVSVVSEGGVLKGTESWAACVWWVYARFPHAALDNPAWSAVIAL